MGISKTFNGGLKCASHNILCFLNFQSPDYRPVMELLFTNELQRGWEMTGVKKGTECLSSSSSKFNPHVASGRGKTSALALAWSGQSPGFVTHRTTLEPPGLKTTLDSNLIGCDKGQGLLKDPTPVYSHIEQHLGTTQLWCSWEAFPGYERMGT